MNEELIEKINKVLAEGIQNKDFKFLGMPNGKQFIHIKGIDDLFLLVDLEFVILAMLSRYSDAYGTVKYKDQEYKVSSLRYQSEIMKDAEEVKSGELDTEAILKDMLEKALKMYEE